MSLAFLLGGDRILTAPALRPREGEAASRTRRSRRTNSCLRVRGRDPRRDDGLPDLGVTALQKRADAPHPAVLQNDTVYANCVPRGQATRVGGGEERRN